MHLVMAGATAPSHVYPGLGVIAELVARGHRVSYVVGDRLADLVASTGAEVIGHESIMPGPEQPWPADPGAAMQVFLDEAIAVLPQMLQRIPTPDADGCSISSRPSARLGDRAHPARSRSRSTKRERLDRDPPGPRRGAVQTLEDRVRVLGRVAA